jgi:hypothetical protein
MAMNKKGIFFTFIAIIIMGLFILLYLPKTNISIDNDKSALETRIIALNDYVNELEDIYFEVVLRATTEKALISLIQYINQTQLYLPDLQAAFTEVMIYGTIGGTKIDSITGLGLMNNNTITNWTSYVANAAEQAYNVNTTIKINKITLNQSNPWKVDTSVNLEIHVLSKEASWNIEDLNLSTSISIEGMHDPYYLINTNGDYGKLIKASGIRYDDWNASKLRWHIRNETYIHWEDSKAPSFLMRFTNDMGNSSCCGIESAIDPNKLESSQEKDQERGYIDYQFWSNPFADQCDLMYNITTPDLIPSGGIWDEFQFFKLHLNNTIKFNITDEHAVRMLFDC